MVISVRKRWEIVFLSRHPKGPKMKQKQVATEVDVSVDTVRYWLKRYEETGDVEEITPSGRPKSTPAKVDKLIISMAESNREVSSVEIQQQLKRKNIEVSDRLVRRRLNESGMVAKPPESKPFLKWSHIKNRLAWAKANRDRDWSRVVFTDETSVHLFRKPARVWKRKGERIIFGTVKHPAKLHLWGCFSAQGFGKLIMFTGILNSVKMCSIYKKGLLPSAKEWFGSDWILQEDNDPKHTSKLCQHWRKKHNVVRMDWPAQSPDQNPIENVWSILKYKVGKKKPGTIKQLKAVIRREWKKLDRNLAWKLANSMHQRIEALIEAKGDLTTY